MDAQELRNLQEAYMEVVENQQLDEDSRRMSNKQKTASVRQNIKAFGSNFTPPNNYDPDANRGKGEVLTRKQIEKKRRKSLRQEEVSVYDIILSHLLDEGYAETPEAAEAIMVNMSEEWRQSIVEEVLDEAEGSYGQTPKADAAYTKLATTKGKSSKTKSLALKHAVRSAADSYNSDKPYSHRSKMTQSDRDYHRGQSENRGGDRGGIAYHRFDTGASGPGGKPKGKKLERQKKTGVSAD